MHDVEPDQQGDTEARFLHRQTLHFAHMGRPNHVEQIADRAGLDCFGRIAGDDRARHCVAGGRHGELAELLGQRHALDQRIDPAHLIPLHGRGIAR